jgi:uncharacterized protein YciW
MATDATATESAEDVLKRILDPVSRCLNPDAARRLAEMRADPVAQQHVERLAEKSTAGTLTPDERTEYATYVAAAALIAILQAKARALLTTQPAA